MLTFFFPNLANAKVYWDDAELLEGQIGRLTILQPINLWERKGDKLVFKRILQKGERYRVYGFDPKHQQYRVGGAFFVTKMTNRVLYETPSKKKLDQLFKENSFSENDILVNQIVKIHGANPNEAEIQQIKKRISQLPITLLGKLKSRNIEVLLIDEPLTNLPQFSFLKGQIPRGWEGTNKTWDDVPGLGGGHTVVIRVGYSEKGEGHGSVNLELHETAHSIDSILYQNLSSTNSFQEIWKKESDNLFSSNPYYQYPEEYFAETFAMYYLNSTTKKELQAKAPLTYTFFQNLQ